MADQAVGGLPQAAEGTSAYGNKFFYMNVLITLASVSGIQVPQEQSVTIAGLLATDYVVGWNKTDGITGGAAALGVIASRVSAASVARLTLMNGTSLAVAAGSATNFMLMIFRPAV